MNTTEYMHSEKLEKTEIDSISIDLLDLHVTLEKLKFVRKISCEMEKF